MQCTLGRVVALLLLAGGLGSGSKALGQPAALVPITPTTSFAPGEPLRPVSAFEPLEPPFESLAGTFASSGAHFVTSQPLVFVDGAGTRWIAPSRTITDGLSIPRLWMSVMGAPTEAHFMKAAILHDAYCAADNRQGASYHVRSRREVNRMFYEALRASGVGRTKARVMYTCVCLFGPARWEMEEQPGIPPVESESVNTAAGGR